jgi:prepilin-type N-terminal cleavage/methylation domain-containing protein
MIRNFYTRNAGVSMLEIIIVIGIFSILSLGAATLLIEATRSNDVIWEQLFTQSEGRRVLKNITDEVRRAEESSIGSYPIAVADEYELTFYANVDSDSYREKVHYWLDGTTLKYGIVKPSGSPLSYGGVETVTEVAHDVLNQIQDQPIFQYFDESYTGSSTSTALTQPVDVADIHMIQIQLELERDPTKSPVPLHVETIVHIRNLKTN